MIQHIALALLIQLGLVLAFHDWSAGAVAACAWSMSREITQAEYRWIEHLGGGLRANMPWWGGLDPRVWQNVDPWLDWIVPSAVVTGLAFVMARKRRTAGRSG
jgi:hypothetical protein